LDAITKCIQPKTIPRLHTHGKGRGNHGKVCTRAVVCRKNSAIVQADIHAVIIEKSMTTRGSDEDLRAEKVNVRIRNMVPHEFQSDHSTINILKRPRDEPFSCDPIGGREVFNFLWC